MLRDVLRGFLHLLIFVDICCAAVLLVLGMQNAFSRVNENLDRRGSLFSLRRPVPSEFSKEYYASYRRMMRLAVAFLAVLALGAFLLWLNILMFGPTI